MAKFAVIVLLALVAVASAKPVGIGGIGGAVVSRNHHVSSSSHIVSPHLGLGLGYGMLGLGGLGHGGIIGHSISSSHSSHHVVPHLGLGGIGGLRGLGLAGMYPGGIGIGYGLLG